MIIHATRKLAQRLPDVSIEPLKETSPLGSWHADRLTIDRRQCVLFCHDETRAALLPQVYVSRNLPRWAMMSSNPCSPIRSPHWVVPMAKFVERSWCWGVAIWTLQRIALF